MNDLTAKLDHLVKEIINIYPDVKDIYLIGSCVHAPELAEDIDIYVFGDEVSEDTLYDNISLGGCDADLIAGNLLEEIEDYFLLASLAGVHLYGTKEVSQYAYDKLYLKGGYTNMLTKAMRKLKTADNNFNTGLGYLKEGDIEQCISDTATAFDCLFHASRLATEVFLGREFENHEEAKKALQEYTNLATKYGDFYKHCHGFLHYHEKFPKDIKPPGQEYNFWRNEVVNYISNITKAVESRQKNKSDSKL